MLLDSLVTSLIYVIMENPSVNVELDSGAFPISMELNIPINL